MRAVAALLASVALSLGVTASAGPGTSARSSSDPRPNIVFILTDDQRWDSMQMNGHRVMPNVDALLGAKGMTLSNYFLTIGLCCPSRVSGLRGQYAHSTGVYSNVGRNGGLRAFRENHDDLSNIATWLQGAGYSTALIGKFLNGYFTPQASYEPPGWTEWEALTRLTYTGFAESVNGVQTPFPSSLYQTDGLADQAVSFIRSVPSDRPLFLYWAPHAPHYPATPAPQDEGACPWLKPFRPPSYNETDVSDKPVSMQKRPMSEQDSADTDAFRIHQCQSLQAVDRGVKDIVTALGETGRLGPDSNTLIVFTSDNGMMYGEHRIFMKKNVAYEEAIRAPFIARWDGVIPAGTTDDRLAVNIDLAPTFADAAGVTPDYRPDGKSLLPILLGGYAGSWRHAFLLEHLGDDAIAPPFCGVRTDRGFVMPNGTRLKRSYAYVWYLPPVDDEELYVVRGRAGQTRDRYADPRELRNRASDPIFSNVVAALHRWVDRNCVPRPPSTGLISGAGDPPA